MECYAWGYPRVEAGIEPDGSPASFDFEGVNGTGFLQLKAGQAAPGMSGAPLVCPARRAIVGMVAYSRNVGTDLGGWAVPLSALMLGGDGMPAELAEAGDAIRVANRAAVIGHRREWNAVLPADDDGVLGQPWADFSRGPRSVPSSLLRADFGVVPYRFREAELDNAVAWCQRADWTTPMSIMQVVARGGAGKTRFAIELCKRLAAVGWTAGLWNGRAGLDRLPLPRLVVIDYAEEALGESLRASLDALSRHATGMAPVQVVMLTRARTGQAADALTMIDNDPDTTARLRLVLDRAEDNLGAARLLTLDQREELYGQGVAEFVRAWCPVAGTTKSGTGKENSLVPDLSHSRHETALDVLFEALAAALDQCDKGIAGLPPADKGDGGSPADRVLAHEAKYWQATAPYPFRGDVPLLRECAGLATLAGAADLREADALLAIPTRLAGTESAAAGRMALSSWLSSMYEGPALLNAVVPDRLGEELICRVLSDQDDDGQAMLDAVLSLESDDQVERCLDVAARLAARPQIAAVAARCVAARHPDLITRCERQARGTAASPGRTALLGSLARLHVALLTDDLVAAFPAESQAQLSRTFDQMGDLARDYGYASQAQMILESALAIDVRLADAEPGNTTYQRDLSISFDKLAGLAVAAGQGERGRELFERSLQIRQGLADAEPGNTTYQRDLSVSFKRLADQAVAAGQGERGRELFERSLQIAQGLADAEPGNTTYQRDLSVSFERLADQAVAAGQGERGRELFERSLQIAQGLADAEPGNTTYQRDLSVSFNKLADQAVAAGQGERGRELFERSLQIAQGLADAEPGNTTYQRDLSISFDKLADQAVAAGQGERGRELFERSLQIRKGLADAEPGNTTYQRDLSISFNKLADQAVAAGQGERGRELFERSLQIRQGLADAEPGNTTYQRDLSVSFERLADQAVAAGQGERGRELFERSLQIRKGLADAEPGNTTYQRDLSISFNKLADQAVAAGQGERGRELFERSLQIRQGLADAEPGNTTYQRDLSISFDKLAGLAVAAGQGERGRELFERSLQIRQGLADAEPGNTTYQRDLSVSFERLADLAVAAGQGERGRELFERSLQIAQGLADAEPGNTTYQRDLSVSFNKLADLAVAAGQGERGRELFERSLQIAQGLADAEPGNTTYQRDLSISFERLADLAREATQTDDAQQWVSNALDIRRQLARDEPTRLDLAEELAYALYLSSSIGVASGAGSGLAQEAVSLLSPFEQLGYATPRALALLAWARRSL